MEELQFIADLCKKYNVICISDEVYEWLVYNGMQHIRIGKERIPFSIIGRGTQLSVLLSGNSVFPSIQ